MSDRIIKIRDLVNKHPDEDKLIVLNDLITNLIQLQVPLGKLEVHNYKESVTDAVKIITEHEKLVSALKYRLKNEVRQEVVIFHKRKPKEKKVMHPNSLKNINS